MWVIKLGGSLLGQSHLKSWLSQIVRYGQAQVVIVPGGGMFADTVRDAQSILHLSDQSAHQMALLAMNQYALLMKDLAPELVLCETIESIKDVHSCSKVALWMPAKVIKDQTHLPQNWTLTSDSIAAWLARELQFDYLVLVKSARIRSQVTINQLVSHEIVDAYLPDLLNNAGFKCWLMQANQHVMINSSEFFMSKPPGKELRGGLSE
jgi:5-(aminomethyl)-3-furanmethanol phosphate kinase